jgi:nucleotide-binding universal stress UspA family protein
MALSARESVAGLKAEARDFPAFEAARKLLLPLGEPCRRRPGLAGDAMTTRIVLGFDGTPEARSAGRFAAQLAIAQRAKLLLVSVIPHPWPACPLSENRAAQEAINEEEWSKAEAALRAESLELLLNAETRVAHGRPAEALASIAAEPDVILVVVGHRDRGPLARIFGFGVSKRLVEICPKPVLRDRQPGRLARVALRAASVHPLPLPRATIAGRG